MSNEIETSSAVNDAALKAFILDGMADELTDVLVEALEKALLFLSDDTSGETRH